ncbi:hypothetical protein TWF694_003684 [Orbilia ellipsospora]|uniref:Plus3 domain-containing protein n=1 Tax=Orbilia ellipsospora TaxID=2528407 RepID=A0AAV9WYV6_9PEZI
MSDDFDDLDNELLGLGDEGDQSDNDRRKHMDDSGDESEGAVSDSTLGSQQRNNKKKPTIIATSPSPPPARRQGVAGADSEDEDDSRGRKDGGVGRKRPSPGDDASSPPKKRAKAAAAKRTKKRKGDSDDEGINSDDSEDYSAGIASEPISSDDDDGDYAGGPSNEIRPLYPYMEHYKDAADKAHLDSLPELEREGVLAERAEEISKWKEAKEMRDRMRRQKQEAERKKKRDDTHLGARRSTRGESSAKKTAESKKKSQLSELVKRRDEKSARKAGVDASDRSRKKRRNASSDRSEGEEDSDSDHGGRGSQPVWTTHEKSSSKKASEEAGLADLKLLIVGRSTIAKFWAHPGFEDATVGCFARVCIGNHPDTGKSVYRLCQIKGWQDSRHIYEVTGGDRTIKFRRNAIIASADAERPTRVDVFSDTAPNEDEFRWWSAAMDTAKLKRPTVDFVERKRQETKNVTQRRLTNEDFEAMRLKRTSYYPDDPILPMLDIPGLKRRRQQLVDQGDEQEILKIDRELEWRAPPKALTANLGKPTQLDILGQINKRNRETNRQDIRKAQIEEKKRNEIAARMAAENGDSSFMDPFARVKTHAKIYHDDPSVKKKEKDKEGDVDMDDLFGGEELKKDNGGPGLGKTDNKVPQVKAGKAKGIDAVIAGLDLQFDIDFDT